MKRVVFILVLLAAFFQVSKAEKSKGDLLLQAGQKPNKVVKYGQCWVFSSLVSGDVNGDNVYEGINELTVTQTNANSKSQALFGVVLAINNTKKDPSTPDLGALIDNKEMQGVATTVLKDCNGNLITLVAKAQYNKTTGKCEFNYERTDREKCALSIQEINLSFTNKCNQTFNFEAKVGPGRTGNGSSATFVAKVNLVGELCENKFNVKSARVKGPVCDMTAERGICLFNGQKVNVDFDIDANDATIASVVVELEASDCNGSNKLFTSTAKFNNKTKLYESELTLPASKDCNWIMNGMNFIVNNPCEQRSVFSVNMASAKTDDNGSWNFHVWNAIKEKDTCDTDFKIQSLEMNGSSIIIEGGSMVFSDNSTLNFRLGIPSLPKTSVASARFDLALTDCKGNNKTISTLAKLNSKTGLYEAIVTIPSSKECQLKLNELNMVLKNTCGDSSVFETSIESFKKGGLSGTTDEVMVIFDYRKVKKDNPCDVKYKVKGATAHYTVEIETVSMTFSVSPEQGSDVPASINVIAEIYNCKNELKYVQVSLSYDSKSGLWSGSEGLMQEKECPWEMTGFNVLAKSPCGEEFLWESDYAEVFQKHGIRPGQLTYHVKRAAFHSTGR